MNTKIVERINQALVECFGNEVIVYANKYCHLCAIVITDQFKETPRGRNADFVDERAEIVKVYLRCKLSEDDVRKLWTIHTMTHDEHKEKLKEIERDHLIKALGDERC